MMLDVCGYQWHLWQALWRPQCMTWQLNTHRAAPPPPPSLRQTGSVQDQTENTQCSKRPDGGAVSLFPHKQGLKRKNAFPPIQDDYKWENASSEENVTNGVEIYLLIELSDLCQCAWNFGSHEEKAILCCTGSQTFSSNITLKIKS